MPYITPKNVWAFSKPKEAALYYEKALIVFNDLHDGGGSSFLENMMNYEIVDLLGMVDMDQPEAQVYLAPAPNITLIGPKFDAVIRGGLATLLEGMGVDENILDVSEEEVGEELLPLRDNIQTIRRIQIGLQTEFLEDGCIMLPETMVSEGGKQDDPAITLSHLNLIDSSQLSWEHIIDIRNDPDSIKKLRNLKLFLHKEYKNEELEFVKDELLRLIDEYEETAKSLGAEMVEGSLSLLFDKDVVASATASMAAIVLGRLDMAAAAATPIVMKVGKAGLELRKKKRDKILHDKNNPVAFLHEVKSSIDNRT